MRAAYVDDTGLHVRENVPRPDPGVGETRVRVLRAGVCATDLALVAGYMGFRGVPGHEFVGVALDGRLAGKRVVGGINAACGRCDVCLAGNERHCPHRTVLGIAGRSGAFAEELVLPTQNLLRVPDVVSSDAATFAEPLAAAYEIADQVDLSRVRRAVVAGDGRLGLLCAWVVASAGVDVVVAGRHPERADLLPPDVPIVTGLLEDDAPPGERPYDLAVEATGHPAVLPRLLRHVAPRGTIVLKTTTERPVTLDLAPLVVDEQTLVGSRCGRFEPALEALARGDVPVERFVQARYLLADVGAAFEHAARRDTLKVLVDVAADDLPAQRTA